MLMIDVISSLSVFPYEFGFSCPLRPFSSIWFILLPECLFVDLI